MGMRSWLKRKSHNTKEYGKKVIAAKDIKEGASFISGLAKTIGTTKSADSVRQETFAHAYERLNLTEESLKKSYGVFSFRFLLFLFFGVVSVLVGIKMAASGDTWAALPLLGFFLFCLAQMFVSSFRMAQMRHRELFPVQVWLRNPQEWWIHPWIERKPQKSKQSSRKRVAHHADGRPVKHRPSSRSSSRKT